MTKGRYKKQGLKQKLTSTPSKLHNTRYAGYKREVYLRNQTSPGTTPFNILSDEGGRVGGVREDGGGWMKTP